MVLTFATARVTVAGLALLMVGQPDLALAAQEQPASAAQSQTASSPSQAPTSAPNGPGAADASQNGAQTIPDSPGAVRAQSAQDSQQNPGATTLSPPAPEQKPQPPEVKPLGTAAAQPVTPSGTAASQPAGAAIAPAKQHRTRLLLIKVGAIVGAGAAVGAVLALSAASPSKPPGSH